MQISNLDHLGLVAGVIDELGLVALTDERIEGHPQQHISAGQVLKAMLLNCLGFVSAPLYLFGEFFESKPIEHLLGPGIEPKHLNDDRLGRVLDQLYELGTTTFFLQAAMQAVRRFEVNVAQVHLDSSSFSVEGDYAAESQEGDGEATEPIPIRICRGYSRDHRPDLKQFLSHLICSADGGIPLWLKVTSGNASDAQEFAPIMSEFAQNWDLDSMFVIDAAFYTQPNLEQVKELNWLSRVPQTLKAAKDLVQQDTTTLVAAECTMPDYQLWEVAADYGGIDQRWILVESQVRREDNSLWEPEMKRLERQLNKELKELREIIFACKPDAYDSLIRFQENLEYHQLVEVKVEAVHSRRGRPSQSAPLDEIQGYRIKGKLKRKGEAAAQIQQAKSRFILATNQLDKEAWPAERLLQEYKGQQKVERGFRFLKDPMFFTNSVFLKRPERVEALALVMALTLLVYSIAERKLRQELAQQEETVLDQKKKPTSKPTFRWILQKFQGLHLVIQGKVKQISNLTDERRKIIRLLGPQAERYYLAF